MVEGRNWIGMVGGSGGRSHAVAGPRQVAVIMKTKEFPIVPLMFINQACLELWMMARFSPAARNRKYRIKSLFNSPNHAQRYGTKYFALKLLVL